MAGKDIIFLSETHCHNKSLGNITNFKVYGDPSFPLFQRHGGLAVYINSFYNPYVNNLRFSKCTLSFTLSIILKIFFMGLYVYPTDSDNFDVGDFGIIADEISYWTSRGFIPFIGGDFNSRLGNINELSSRSLHWRYNENVDTSRNGNYNDFVTLCEVLKISPINHCLHKDRIFNGHWTYFKSNKKSQIDFLVTNSK